MNKIKSHVSVMGVFEIKSLLEVALRMDIKLYFIYYQLPINTNVHNINLKLLNMCSFRLSCR